MGERGKFSSFAFGVVLQNTFNDFRDINSVSGDDYEYCRYCEELASQLYEYAGVLPDNIIV